MKAFQAGRFRPPNAPASMLNETYTPGDRTPAIHANINSPVASACRLWVASRSRRRS